MAINFPASPTTGDIHTASGIQWQWDGTGGTWKCLGVTGIYQLGIATATSLGGIKVGDNLSINASTGVLAAVMNLNNESIAELSDVTFNNVTLDASNGAGKVLAWDQSLQAFAPVDQSGGGQGGGATTLAALTDTDLTTIAPVGGNILYYDQSSTKWIPAPFTIDFIAGVDTTTTLPTDGQVLVYDASTGIWKPGNQTGSGGGSSLQSRTTVAGTTASIGAGGSANLDLVAAKTFALLKVETSHAAWVTIYSDNNSRQSDASRAITVDPDPGLGILTEVITSGNTLQQITPAAMCWNNDNTTSTNTYLKVTNQGTSAATITVTLTYVALEA
tara:strand:- start:3311 stop:4303 length:993 start_codon:yes stop_codon:yes gene_type:complete